MSIRRALCSTLERFGISISCYYECNECLSISHVFYTRTIIFPPALLSQPQWSKQTLFACVGLIFSIFYHVLFFMLCNHPLPPYSFPTTTQGTPHRYIYQDLPQNQMLDSFYLFQVFCDEVITLHHLVVGLVCVGKSKSLRHTCIMVNANV